MMTNGLETIGRHHSKRWITTVPVLLICLWLLTPAIPVEAVDPVVSNAVAAQRAETKLVDITYDVSDTDGDNLTVSVQVSSDSGVTYSVPATSFSGDYGSNILPGTGKKIVWDAGVDWNQQYSQAMRFKVVASGTGQTISRYVDSSLGSDSAGDGSSGNPWASIHHAIVNTYTGNAKIYVRAGTYNEQIIIQSTYLSGLQLIGDDSQTTIIDASGVTENGGAVKISSNVSSFSISGFTIKGGTFEGYGGVGGGIRGENSSVTIENNYITGNFSYGYENCAGGITVGDNSMVKNNTISGNGGRYCAGGVYVGANSIIENNVISNNYILEAQEGCSSVFGNGNLRGGGGIQVKSASVIIRNNKIIDNMAGSMSSGSGGGIHGIATIKNNFIADNSVDSYNNGFGGGIYALPGAVVVNNTLTGNIGDSAGNASGIYACNGSTVINNIIVNGSSGVGLHVDVGSSIVADYNNIWNNDQGSYGGDALPGAHDIHADPLFVNASDNDYHIRSGSPAINAGTSNYAPADDYDGDARPINGGYDIGADEYTP